MCICIYCVLSEGHFSSQPNSFSHHNRHIYTIIWSPYIYHQYSDPPIYVFMIIIYIYININISLCGWDESEVRKRETLNLAEKYIFIKTHAVSMIQNHLYIYNTLRY